MLRKRLITNSHITRLRIRWKRRSRRADANATLMALERSGSRTGRSGSRRLARGATAKMLVAQHEDGMLKRLGYAQGVRGSGKEGRSSEIEGCANNKTDAVRAARQGRAARFFFVRANRGM